jgi:hypothetical protein
MKKYQPHYEEIAMATKAKKAPAKKKPAPKKTAHKAPAKRK